MWVNIKRKGVCGRGGGEISLTLGKWNVNEKGGKCIVSKLGALGRN